MEAYQVHFVFGEQLQLKRRGRGRVFHLHASAAPLFYENSFNNLCCSGSEVNDGIQKHSRGALYLAAPAAWFRSLQSVIYCGHRPAAGTGNY